MNTGLLRVIGIEKTAELTGLHNAPLIQRFFDFLVTLLEVTKAGIPFYQRTNTLRQIASPRVSAQM